MKRFFFLMILFGLLTSFTDAGPNTNDMSSTEIKSLISNNIGDQITPDEDCTLSIKIYVPTQSGIIGVGLSITADTCEEAREGIGDAINGFISEIF
ncbi:hypothetical protein GWK08_05870 [Leptobacterium flavescens]|uniref:Uncharacterized protein n=1 Tax=Leptobacterium flavescens TaxID=472055 RepID=A0A6P0UJ04_9FLAO|nr:hypothetical protein [Leptobacterium flavescens]NER12957.1 hypothetical protein [Leptobacterium flavescens]